MKINYSSVHEEFDIVENYYHPTLEGFGEARRKCKICNFVISGKSSTNLKALSQIRASTPNTSPLGIPIKKARSFIVKYRTSSKAKAVSKLLLELVFFNLGGQTLQ